MDANAASVVVGGQVDSPCPSPHQSAESAAWGMMKTAILPDQLALNISGALQDASIAMTFEPHSDLFSQGDVADRIYGLLSGKVKFWRLNAAGVPCTMLMLGAGEILGSLAVAQGLVHPTSATALSQVRAIAWPAGLVRDELRRNVELSRAFLGIVTRRACQLIDRFEDSASLSVEDRLAHLLLRLTAEFGQHDQDLSVVLDVRQQELAEMTFSTVPTISRILSRWEASGLISKARGSIKVHELSRLASAADLHLD